MPEIEEKIEIRLDRGSINRLQYIQLECELELDWAVKKSISFFEKWLRFREEQQSVLNVLDSIVRQERAEGSPPIQWDWDADEEERLMHEFFGSCMEGGPIVATPEMQRARCVYALDSEEI